MKRHDVAAIADRWQDGRVLFGCDYNFEQWTPDVWVEDVALMREAGVDLVAINIFGWACIQPSEHSVDFTSLDSVIELLHDAGIRINLGTGTSSPPPWLSTLHPEILPVASDGTSRWPGGRQAWCPSSPIFRDYALALVAQVAQRYGSHPAVALWHVSNELGCHNSLCYCDVSAAAFRRWLELRYGTIGCLNDAWGTSFWSQRYDAWDEVLPPRDTLSAGNPAHQLDFARFSSDELLDYFRAETAILRSASTVPVTTNFMVTAHIRTQDYWQWAPEMDIVANDHYLDNRLDHPASELSFAADVTRGLANGAPWMLMETSTSAVSWQPRNVAKAPGELLRNVAAHVARGADAVCFFQWRASRQGAEKFHSALLPHSGTDSKIWRETLAVGRMLSALQPVSGSRVTASVALVFSWQSWWAAEGPSQPSADVRYLDQVHRAYEALRSTGVTVDIVPAGGRFDDYDVVVVPCLYLLTDDEAATVTDYVSGGGTAIVTFFSGVVDEDDRIRVDPTGAVRPGAFSELLGAWTEEYFPLLPGQQVILSTGATGSLWSEVTRPTTASVLSTFIDGPVAGHPAVLSNRYGAGRAVYIATALDATSFAEMMGELLADALVAMPAVPVGVERIVRVGDDAHFTFVINHTVADVTIDGVGCELITGLAVDGRMVVPAGSVRVLSERLA